MADLDEKICVPLIMSKLIKFEGKVTFFNGEKSHLKIVKKIYLLLKI